MKPAGQLILSVVFVIAWIILVNFVEYAATQPVLVFLIFATAALCGIAWAIFELAKPR